MRQAFICSFLFAHLVFLKAQDSTYPLYNESVYHHIDRFDILYRENNFLYTSNKAYSRRDVVKYAVDLDSSNTSMSQVDKAFLQYIFVDNNELNPSKLSTNQTTPPPQYKNNKNAIFKYFYQTPANLFEVSTRSFNLKVNPILNTKIAIEQAVKQPIFLNQRGIELRGSVDNRVYFYSNIVESQARFPNYVSNWIEKYKSIPGSNLYKTYTSTLLNIENGYDYLSAQGYVGFNLTPYIGVQIGQNQHFIGDGMRSLFLSDFPNNYFNLKFTTRLGKFQYTNIFAELNNGVAINLDHKKYLALNQLSYNINKNLNFGVLESTIMNRTQHFEFQYLNPIIFYRSIDHLIGSPDNVLLGMHFKWNVAKRFSFYGQTFINGFSLKDLFINNRGWWGNKYGTQLGVKYVNALNIDHLDVQFEYNKVRPFTYSSPDIYQSYTHASRSLAHPLGAGFEEVLVKARLQPMWKFIVDGRLMYARVGENSTTENWGNEPIVPSTTKKNEDGYFTTKGVQANILLITLDISYQFHHNMFADIQILARKKDSQESTRNERTFFFGGGLRMNFGNMRNDF
jgi:hypothetical protein